MSRMGKKPVKLNDASVTINGQEVIVKGPKGQASLFIDPLLDIFQQDGFLLLKPKQDTKLSRARLGMQRTLLSNLIEGVTKGFELKIIISGVGYRAVMEGRKLQAIVGKSHVEVLDIPEDIHLVFSKPTEFTVFGTDKQKIGEFASIFRRLRPVEPYKAKGIRFERQKVLRKEGKKK